MVTKLETYQEKALSFYFSDFSCVCPISNTLACDKSCFRCHGAGSVTIDIGNPTENSKQLALVHLDIAACTKCLIENRMSFAWMNTSGATLSTGKTMPEATKIADAKRFFSQGFIKPVGYPIAMAHVFLRLLAISKISGVDLMRIREKQTPELEISDWIQLRYLHDCLAGCIELPHEDSHDDLILAITQCLCIAATNDIDIYEMSDVVLKTQMV